ncbi:hypothetical protein ACFW0P_06010 [Lysobacter soli]|uniref:hypothetical protein n=1 Tax=Lysobacter soli TaxID=453783 RepID=UPI00368BD967
MNAPAKSKAIVASRFGYPFKDKQEREITDPQALYEGLSFVQGGHYLLGAHGFFHGGIHFDRSCSNAFSLDQGIRCLADGEVIAYRINCEYLDATRGTPGDGPTLRPYSTGFVLVRHRLQAPTPPQPYKPAPMDHPMVDARNMGTYLYSDPEGRRRARWLRHGTPLTVEIGKYAPGRRYLRVHGVGGPGSPATGWISPTWLALDPAAGTSLFNVLGFKEEVSTFVQGGDHPDPERVAAYKQNKAERERPAPAPAPALTLYSLYMHVADFADYRKQAQWKRPAWWSTKRYRVGKKATDGRGGAPEHSGRQWISRFPTSQNINDLTPGFASSVARFTAALTASGATVQVNATHRPPERAYLMHYAWRIAREGLDPASVPSMEGVDIDWAHANSRGVTDVTAARQAARDMVDGYRIVFRPSLTSRHTEGRAIDMNIAGAIGRTIVDATGRERTVGSSADLHEIGRSYGVIKLATDPPHWSDDGH